MVSQFAQWRPVLIIILVMAMYSFGFKIAFISFWCVYLISYFDGSEYTGERYWPWFATHVVFKRLFALLPAQIKYTCDLDPAKQYIFASHPHGVMSLHHVMLMTNGCNFHDTSPGHTRRAATASIVFSIPFFRDVALWLGGVHCGKKTCIKMLNSGKSLTIVVGGTDEQLLSKARDYTFFLKNRKGFVKLALRTGVPIVPAIAFGETDLYQQSRIFYGFRRSILKALRISLILPWGRKFLFLLPRKVPLIVVLGSPLEVPKIQNPTTNDLNEYHERYVENLKCLFKENQQYANGAQLNII